LEKKARGQMFLQFEKPIIIIKRGKIGITIVHTIEVAFSNKNSKGINDTNTMNVTTFNEL
jgi:hypothetical protein